MQLINCLFYAFFFCNNPVPIYDLTTLSASGEIIRFNDYHGKKILLVNIATGSSRVNQLAELQQLQQQYINEVIVVVFPSNSFGNEPLNDSQIVNLCHEQYGISFPIAAKSIVKGSWRQGIYSWLGDSSNNGSASLEPVEDFTKYIISSNGQICGVFAGEVLPSAPLIINAITNPNN